MNRDVDGERSRDGLPPSIFRCRPAGNKNKYREERRTWAEEQAEARSGEKVEESA